MLVLFFCFNWHSENSVQDGQDEREDWGLYSGWHRPNAQLLYNTDIFSFCGYVSYWKFYLCSLSCFKQN